MDGFDRLLRKFDRHARLSDEEKRFLLDAPWRVLSYAPNESIVEQGDSPPDSCLVLEGFALRSKLLPEGTRQILAFHIPGDFCDLHSFVLPTMDHAIAASGPCTIGRLPHRRLAEITERYPALSRVLWLDTAIDAAIHREWMISMGRRDAYRQMAHLFCELLVRFQSVGLAEDNEYPLPVTQEQLGDTFGLSTVHVNRTLKKLRADTSLVVAGGRVTVPNPERLKAVAGFDPTYLQVGRALPG